MTVIHEANDVEQLTVQGHTTQTEPLQDWENSAGDPLARVTGDGHVQVGDFASGELDTDDALVKLNRDTSNSAKKGIHSRAEVAAIASEVVQWILHELSNTGGSSGSPVSELTGMRLDVRNAASAYLDKAYGLRINVEDENDPSQTNTAYAIHTENGLVHLGDVLELVEQTIAPDSETGVMRIYPKTDGKLYAKNAAGTEFDLTVGGASFDALVSAANPVAWYKFDESSGDIINYGSYSSFDATATGIAYGASDLPGSPGAVEYDSVSDGIETPAWNTTLPQQTIGVLIRVRSFLGVSTRIFNFENSNNFWLFETSFSVIAARRALSGTHAYTLTDEGIDEDTWTLLWMTYDDSDDKIVRLYKDTGSGISQLSTTTETAGVGTLETLTDAMVIGNRAGYNRGGDFDLGAFVVFPSVLSTQEMNEIGAAAFAHNVIGPASSTDNGIALFAGTEGTTLQDSAKTISVDGTLASNSDAKVPTEKAVKTYVDANGVSIAILADKKSSGTDGGSITGSSWNQHDLNATVSDPDSIISNFSSNQFELQAGNYRGHIVSTHYLADMGRLRLYNITDAQAVPDSVALNGGAGNLSNAHATLHLDFQFTIAGTKAFRVDQYAQTTRSSDGFGLALGTGDDEVYMIVYIEKF